MNCLSLRACYLFFECDNVFFNLENYRFYKKEEMQKLLYDGNLYTKADFIPVPHINDLESPQAYLLSLNDRILLERFNRMTKKEFIHNFHIMFQGDSGERYSEFAVNYLMDFGARWCEQVGIKFTRK